jgi:lipopolysaccharide transport system permease protein
VPVGVAWLVAFTVGIIWLGSAAAVFVRDVLSALPLLIQVGAFIAPIGYSTSEFGSTLKTIVDLNPMTGLIEFWRWTLLHGPGLPTLAAVTSVAGTLIAVIAGWRFFGNVEPTMADII